MRNITLNINDIDKDNVEFKCLDAIEKLCKTLEVDYLIKSNGKYKESPSPIHNFIINTYLNKIKKDVNSVLKGCLKLLSSVKKSKEDDEPFKIKGVPVINPQTGRFITKKEWNKIYSSIDDFLQSRLEKYGYEIAEKSAISSIIFKNIDDRNKTMDDIGKGNFEIMLRDSFDDVIKENDFTENDFRVTNLNFERTADYITDINERTKKEIKQVFIQSFQERLDAKQTEQILFDRFSSLNKDWERIVVTEVSNVSNGAYLEAEVAGESGDEPIYFIGKMRPNACSICQRDIGNVIVKWVESPLDDDKLGGDKFASHAIWSGKTSIGYSLKERWVSIPRHPHCYCIWLRYYPA